MAIWQYEFQIIPEKEVAKHFNGDRDCVKIDNTGDSLSWNGYSIIENSLETISKTLKQGKSWSVDIKQFGFLEETCVELFYEKDKLVEISIRLDLRNLSPEVLNLLIDFIKENNAIALTQEGILFRPSVEHFVKEIKKSDAYSFIKNPKAFLESLKPYEPDTE